MSRALGLLVVGVAFICVTCGIAIRRDLSTVQPGQVGFDDMCGLQEYFDALEIKTSPPPRVVSALDLEGTIAGKRVRGGKERFAFENDFQLKHVRRVLNENWRRLPETIDTAPKIEIEVKWSEKAGSKRVLTDESAELTVGGESSALPYHVCLSELLYGETLYRQRRVMWGLPLPAMPVSRPDAGPGAGDGGAGHDGAVDAGRPDAARPDR
jgi:hypothetical protein